MRRPIKIAKIREIDCIGCTKCIVACPVDAIVGTKGQMHTIIAKECTGCQLCIAPCPVDCIELVEATVLTADERKNRAQLAKKRVNLRQVRLKDQQMPTLVYDTPSVEARKAAIELIMKRVKIRG